MRSRRLLGFILLALPLLALAQDKSGACRADREQFCSQHQSGGQEATDCLLDHQQEVSDACYESLRKRLEAQRGLKACQQDSASLCKGVEPGGGRIVRCLLTHQKEVSDACYDTLAQLSQRGQGGRSGAFGGSR